MKIHFLIAFSFIAQSFFGQINQYHEDGTRHGLWEKKFDKTDQIRYTGNFNHGIEIGKFKYYTKGFPKQPSAVKSFSDKGRKAEIIYYTQKGTPISKGTLINRKREGRWEYFHNRSSNLMMVENYENDVLQGTVTSYYQNKQISETTQYVNGKKEGKQLVYSIKGILIKEFTYLNNLLNGSNKFYNGKGLLTINGNYNKNKKIGVWKYYENSKLIKEKQY